MYSAATRAASPSRSRRLAWEACSEPEVSWGSRASVDRRRLSAAFALAYGVVLVLTALNPWFWGLPPLLVLAGASMTISNTSANSLLQATANPLLLGQTVSLYMLAVRGGSSIGSLLTGATVSLLGVQHAFLLNGLAALAVQAVIARMWLRSPSPITNT